MQVNCYAGPGKQITFFNAQNKAHSLEYTGINTCLKQRFYLTSNTVVLEVIYS